MKQNAQSTELAATRNGGGQAQQTPNGGGEAEQSPGSQLARRNPFALLDELRPRLDVYEQDGYLVVKADVPGAKKEDVRVELDDGDLVIQGETRTENEVKEDQYYRMERRLGRFYRRVPLPFEVKAEDVQATMNDGVLEVRIPKPTEAKSPGTPIPVK